MAPSSTAFEGGLRETSAVLAISLEIEEDAALMNYSVEHFRAVEAPGEPLGYEFVPTGRVETVEAHDEAAAAAIALSEDEIDLDVVSYDPSRNLYGVGGADEEVRVTVRLGGKPPPPRITRPVHPGPWWVGRGVRRGSIGCP